MFAKSNTASTIGESLDHTANHLESQKQKSPSTRNFKVEDCTKLYFLSGIFAVCVTLLMDEEW